MAVLPTVPGLANPPPPMAVLPTVPGLANPPPPMEVEAGLAKPPPPMEVEAGLAKPPPPMEEVEAGLENPPAPTEEVEAGLEKPPTVAGFAPKGVTPALLPLLPEPHCCLGYVVLPEEDELELLEVRLRLNQEEREGLELLEELEEELLRLLR